MIKGALRNRAPEYDPTHRLIFTPQRPLRLRFETTEGTTVTMQSPGSPPDWVKFDGDDVICDTSGFSWGRHNTLRLRPAAVLTQTELQQQSDPGTADGGNPPL